MGTSDWIQVESRAENLVATLECLDGNLRVKLETVDLDWTKWHVEVESCSLPFFAHILYIEAMLLLVIILNALNCQLILLDIQLRLDRNEGFAACFLDKAL